MNTDTEDEARAMDEAAASGMMKMLRNVAAQIAGDWFGEDSGVIVIVSHDHPDDDSCGRVRVSTNMGNDVASRLMYELACEYARNHGLELDGAPVYVAPGDEQESPACSS